MSMILSVLAIAIALIAVWMVSQSSKSSEGGLNAFLQSARTELNTTKTEIDKNLSETIKRLNDLSVIIENVNENSSKSNTMMSDLQRELELLRHDLETLEASIPKQYRNLSRKSSGNLHH